MQSVLKLLIAEYPEIRSAYLFGSVAQGIDRSTRDVDIAIRCDPEIPPESCFHLNLKLMAAVEDALGRKTDMLF